MIPSTQIDFSLMSSSYGFTLLFLSLALRSHSPALTLHMTHLILRHSPFLGLPGVDIFLTSNAEAFCTWLGLDYARWHQRRMANEEETWSWLTEVAEDSVLARAWKELAIPREDIKLTGQKVKSVDVDRFVKWLRSPRSKWYDRDAVIAAAEVDEARLVDSAVVVRILDPEHASPLDARAMQALAHWGKAEEYDKIVEERRIVAREVRSRQKRRGVASHSVEKGGVD